MRGWVRRGLWQAGVVVFVGRELAAQAAPRPERLPARPVEPPIEITPTTPLPDAGRMWRFEAPPTAYWMARYGFAPDAAWLRHVRRAVLRIPGCTASFVSASGLVLTNHHCAREAATQVQPADGNYQATGFIARTLAEERRIDGFTAERLDSIEDVTARIAARRAQRTAAHEADPHAAAMRALEAECVAPNEVCEVVSLYQGGRYARYRYTQFTDVRLVAIPEAQVAFFGGDQDNFTYPRFNLDFALLRVYDERGAPLVPTEHLRLNADGVREHDPVFVVGNPGATSRLHTVAQLRFERDHGVPLQLLDLEQQREVLAHRAGDAPSAQQQDALFALDNAIKAMRGQLAGLSDSALLARKARFEGTLRERVQASPRWRLAYGVAWDRLAEALARRAPLERTRAAFGGGASELWTRALGLVRLPEQAALPDARRLPPYRGDGLERVRQQVLAPVPLDTGAERLALVRLLTDATALLGASDPVVRQLLGGRTAEETVRGWLRDTRLLDAQERRKLLGGGERAVAASRDPLVVAVRLVDPTLRAANTKIMELLATERTEAARVGDAHYAVYGDLLPPDATFTLRITDGVMAGYPMNGTRAPWMSSFYGLYARWTEFGRTGAYALPRRWVDRKELLDLATPFTMVSTNDIVGGSSGSPLLNRRGELVGLVFDGNIESLAGEYAFDESAGRAVSLHAKAITTALRVMYDAAHLADELEGKSGPKRPAGR